MGTEVATQVQELLAAHVDAEGKLNLPDDVDPAIAHAVRAEKRFRDTQASYTRERQNSKSLEEVNKRLTNQLIDTATLHISAEQRNELEELKLRDPDTWRERLTEYETEARDRLKSKIDEFTEAGQKVSAEVLYTATLEDFNSVHKVEYTQEYLEDNIPAAYTKKLGKGEITFAEYLSMAHKFVQGKVVIKDTEEPTNSPKVSGSNKPSKEAESQDLNAIYRNTVF